jgi:uncharacterized membrane protein
MLLANMDNAAELRQRGLIPGRSAIRVASLGHALLVVILIGFGISGLIEGHFTAIWSGVPKATPGRVALAYLCALVCLGTGIGLLVRRAASIAARVLLAYLVLWMLLFRVPLLVRAPASSGSWWVCGETAALLAAAWVLCVAFAGERRGTLTAFITGEKGLRIARTLYGLALIPFGVAHFTFLERTVSLVPGWLPWHLGWAYFTGGAFIVAGVAIVIGVLAPLAATLSAWEMTLFTVLVWVPILITRPDVSQWNEFVDSWALTAAAWLVAESYRPTAATAIRE